MRRLTLALTRRCNLRCGFCPQAFFERDMPPELLDAALAGLLPAAQAGASVRLFGGEPLLAFPAVRRAVAAVSRLAPGLRVELPTNGILLDERVAALLRRHPEVEVALSRPAARARALPNVVFNVLLAPGEPAQRAVARAGRLALAGYRSLNFLPAYFVRWTAAELGELSRTFSGLATLLWRLKRRGVRVRVVNRERLAAVPLYGDGFCVDVDGSVYASSLALAAAAAPAAAALRLGRVGGRLRRAPPPETLSRALEACWPADVLEATAAADAALTHFVHALD